MSAKESDAAHSAPPCEPCAGTGSFFSSLRRGFPAELIESALAYELDQGHAAVAKSLWHDAGLSVKNSDFLAQPPAAKKFNLLITNPPYVRHHHLDQTRKEELQALVRERLHLRLSGLAGLYCYFPLLADAWLEDGGLAVWLIPSEFMDVNYCLRCRPRDSGPSSIRRLSTSRSRCASPSRAP